MAKKYTVNTVTLSLTSRPFELREDRERLDCTAGNNFSDKSNEAHDLNSYKITLSKKIALKKS